MACDRGGPLDMIIVIYKNNINDRPSFDDLVKQIMFEVRLSKKTIELPVEVEDFTEGQ